MSNGNGNGVVRVNLALDADSRVGLEGEAARHGLSLSQWLRVVGKALHVSAPPERALVAIREDIAEIIRDELKLHA